MASRERGELQRIAMARERGELHRIVVNERERERERELQRMVVNKRESDIERELQRKREKNRKRSRRRQRIKEEYAKSNRGGVCDAEENQAPLQAILLADASAEKFRPITLERPKVLLPLLNIPMIEYSLSWLRSSGVKEVFVVCCSHSKQVIEYLENSQWLSAPNITVEVTKFQNSVSVGDALRVIFEKSLIHGDFVLIRGDTVSNMCITEALEGHKERKKKNKNAIMTMLMNEPKRSIFSYENLYGYDEMFITTDGCTNELLYYEDKAAHCLRVTSSLTAFSANNVEQDCFIYICCPEVLKLFASSTYKHLHQFIKGLLNDITGFKIFTHQVNSSYANRVDNFRSYDTISQDLIQTLKDPSVLDALFFGHCQTKQERQGIYSALDVGQSHFVEHFTVVGSETTIGDFSKISNSVIGKGCTIGSNVSIEGSYIWNNVTIEDGCRLSNAIICDGVVIKSGSILEPGVILSFKVVVGPRFMGSANLKVSLLPVPTKQDSEDSDEELEYDMNSWIIKSASMTSTLYMPSGELIFKSSDTSEDGVSIAGYSWSCEGQEEDWRNTISPMPTDVVLG